MRLNKNTPFLIIGLLFLKMQFFSNPIYAQEVTIIDESHYSNVLGEIRNYRIFLPKSYDSEQKKNYPVIYYYHGWSQRYFGSINEINSDVGDSNDGDNIANFVANNEVIVVKTDGYNRRPDEEYNLRPFNIGPVENYRQFPLYFPELVSHIDISYRTIADREHRAVSGLSMGGFMTFWISGKYPHLVSAAGNFCGSTEFVVGPKDFPVEYRHQDMYKNYDGINLRLNYGDEDFIRAYHRDMNKVWTQVLDNYEYEIYNAGHSTAGLGEMFDFLMESFENPPAKPSRWNHIDVYPEFSVWGYEVKTDRNVPGFTVLENVNQRGFRSSIRTFLPDGELMQHVNLTVMTPPIYEKNQLYEIHKTNPLNGASSASSIKSDEQGKLKIDLNGGIYEVGINKKEDAPNLVIARYGIKNRDWATHNKENNLSISLLNKAPKTAGKVTAEIQPTRESAVVLQSKSTFGDIEAGEIKNLAAPFTFIVKDNKIEIERFKLTIRDENGNEWNDFIDIPIRTDEPEIDFVIADGREFTVASAGDDTETIFLGKGNGDGKANPGESIVILAKNNGKYHRTFLYSSNPYVNPEGIHIRKSDSWGPYDHVGASAKYSIPVLASDSPDNHEIKLFAEYWLPDYPDHIIQRGVVSFRVSGTDQVAPQLEWVKLSGDNTIKVKLYDGGKITSVKAKFHLIEDPEKSFEIELNNNGEQGDLTPGDLVFSKKIQLVGFGLYQVEIEAVDNNGNKMKKEWPETLVVH